MRKIKTLKTGINSKINTVGVLNCIRYLYKQPEYYLTIQQVLQKRNVGKYFESEDGIVWQLQLNYRDQLELVVVQDDNKVHEELDLMQECYTLEAILDTCYKQVRIEYHYI